VSQLIQVEFAPGGQRYTYSTEQRVHVGDKVRVFTEGGTIGPRIATVTVVEIGSDYTGPVKAIFGRAEEA
jgi:hypothetical protein